MGARGPITAVARPGQTAVRTRKAAARGVEEPAQRGGQPVAQTLHKPGVFTPTLPSGASLSNVEAAASAVGRRARAGMPVVLAQTAAPHDELLSWLSINPLHTGQMILCPYYGIKNRSRAFFGIALTASLWMSVFLQFSLPTLIWICPGKMFIYKFPLNINSPDADQSPQSSPPTSFK